MNPNETLDIEQDTQFDDFPPINEALITALERRMPERWPNVDMPDRDIWFRAGQHEVVAFLKFVLKTQRSSAPKDNL